MTLLLVLGVLTLFGAMSFGGWRIHRRQPHHVLQRAMQQMREDLQRFAVVLGTAFIPATKAAVESLRELTKAVNDGSA